LGDSKRLSWLTASLTSSVPIFHWMAAPPWPVNAAQLSARSSMRTASAKLNPYVVGHGPKNARGSSLLSTRVWLEQMMSSRMTLRRPAPVHRFLSEFIELVCSRRIDPGRVFDFELPLKQAAEGYRAIGERRAIRALLAVAADYERTDEFGGMKLSYPSKTMS
jgi:hypothetical protein